MEPQGWAADPEAARVEAIALYGEDVVTAAEAAFDAACLLGLALAQTDQVPDEP